MHIHILGICGTFMGGIAAIAAQAGFKVSGCDANVYPPMSDQLKRLGISLIEGFEPDQLSIRPDYWIVGNIVARGNPLMEAILNAGQPYISGPQWLYEQVLRQRRVCAIAGTHGKTTTTAMLRHIMLTSGLQPGWLVGGVPADGAPSAALGADEHFVIEADEYDTAFFDKRSKFVHYRPRVAVLNNLEFDHADIFDDLAQIQTQFHHLVRTVPGDGCIIRAGDSAALDAVMERGVWTPVQTFGERGTWSMPHGANCSVDDRSGPSSAAPDSDAFEVRFRSQLVGRCELTMAGHHNRLNALAAIAAAVAAGVEPAQAVAAMASFEGVKRRLEVKGVVDDITVIDDFAHHPTAIALTIAGLRERLAPGQRLLAVLEPRSNTMRAGSLNERLATSLAGADQVFCFAHGLSWNPAEVFDSIADRFSSADTIDQLITRIVAHARPADTILIMSNGGFGGIHHKLLAALEQRAQTSAPWPGRC